MRLARATLLLLALTGTSLLLTSRGGSSRRQRLRASAGCSTAIASARVLPGVRTAFEHVSAPPFGIATTEDGRWSFVDELGGRVALFSDGGLAPR